MRGYRVLITGGAGFIGSNLAARLAPQNRVIVLDDLSSGFKRNLHGTPVKFVKGSLLNMPLLTKICKGVDYVFHLAAVASVQESVANPEHCFRVNILGSLNVIRACIKCKVKKFLFSSSAAVYGDNPQLPKRETMLPVPISPYAASKLAVEHQSIVNSRLYGLKFVCLRLFNVYGPRQNPNSPYSGVISRFLEAALSNKPLRIFGKGTQTRDFVYVDDVVSAFILAAKSRHNGIYNIAGGNAVTINRLARVILRLVGSGSKLVHEQAKPGDIMHSIASIAKARQQLGWRPKVEIGQGLNTTLEWLKGN